jgi:hypothetical protein
VVLAQVPLDGVGAGVESLAGQFLAEPEDQVSGLLVDRGWRGRGAAGLRFECGVALSLVAVFELVDPGAVDAVAGGDLRG